MADIKGKILENGITGLVMDVNGKEVGMSTDDFAQYRHVIGQEPFGYDGTTIVGYADQPFRNFRTQGDKDFLVDAMRARTGPAFDDFREAINNGSIFSIITARGHNPDTIKQAIYNYIIEGFGGIDKDELVKNLKKYRSFAGEGEMSDEELIKSYLELNKYHPVSFGDEQGAVNPEEAKVEAMENFVNYIKGMAAVLNKRAFLKKDIANKFVPKKLSIGFSDDDPKNIEVMKKHFKAYVNGFDGAKELRVKLMGTQNYSEVKKIINSFTSKGNGSVRLFFNSHHDCIKPVFIFNYFVV
jgi:hypothetical protein